MGKGGGLDEIHKNLPAVLPTDKASKLSYEYEVMMLIIT
jgi:hypothetical protein